MYSKKLTKLFVFVLLAIMLWDVYACSPSEGRASLVRSNFYVRLVLNKSTYSLNDKIGLDVLLSNKSGSSALYVYNWFIWSDTGGLSFVVTNRIGDVTMPNIRVDPVPFPPPKNDLKVFVQLLDPNFYGTHIEVPVELFVKRPGIYSIQARYRSPVSCRWFDRTIQNLPIVWRNDGVFVSNAVSFSVIAK